MIKTISVKFKLYDWCLERAALYYLQSHNEWPKNKTAMMDYLDYIFGEYGNSFLSDDDFDFDVEKFSIMFDWASSYVDEFPGVIEKDFDENKIKLRAKEIMKEFFPEAYKE